MVKGLYTAYTGMINEQNRMDVLTNNLANVDTNGYKKEGATSQAFDIGSEVLCCLNRCPAGFGCLYFELTLKILLNKKG